MCRNLEGAEDPPPELERVIDGLHPRRVRGELGMAEIRLACPRGHDQAVVRDGRATVERVHHQQARIDVDVHHLAQEDRCVRLTAEDVAYWRRDLALGQDAGRHLVEQRLEEVMVGAVDVTVTSTSACRSARAANRPPKPPPTIATRCRRARDPFDRAMLTPPTARA
jgi:hypothetical protein